ENHSLFIKTDDSLWAMGGNGHGQLGDGTKTDRVIPVKITDGILNVVTGGFGNQGHSLFIRTDGSLWAMGYNGYGQLGDGTTTDRSNPIQIGSNSIMVATGGRHSISVFGAP
ncbi:MAG: RCC1 repeat-containing protein, partial [Verrucomicrobiae bacterium]|nr:RCC1 repeat-containing protein [Verrucomicrobiae bacterium]